MQFWQSDPIANKMFIQYPSLNFKSDSSTNPYTIYVNDNIKYQQIDGFGKIGLNTLINPPYAKFGQTESRQYFVF